MTELNAASDNPTDAPEGEVEDQTIVCPVCGAVAVPEKCKVICKSDLCRGRVIYNCAEF
jgi:hypothetical protein